MRRTYTFDRTQNKEVWILRLEIQSAILREAFKKIVQGFTSVSLEQNPIVLKEPFSELYFCRDQIRRAIREAASSELRKELGLLEAFRESYMAKTIMSIETSFVEGKIEAADLWSLFPVGSKVILQNKHAPGRALIWCAIVKRCHEVEREKEKLPVVWAVEVEFTGFNGKRDM